MIVHLLREWLKDRYKDARWFAWVTGVGLLWLVYASGISGYWIVWDQLAQYIAIETSEWLDTLPIFGEPIARNFLHESILSGRFFTLMVFWRDQPLRVTERNNTPNLLVFLLRHLRCHPAGISRYTNWDPP